MGRLRVVERSPEPEIFANGKLGVELGLMADPADGAPAAVHLCAPALRLDEACEYFEERGLPGPVGTGDRERVAGLYAEGDVVESRHGTEAMPQPLSQQHRWRPRARSVRRV